MKELGKQGPRTVMVAGVALGGRAVLDRAADKWGCSWQGMWEQGMVFIKFGADIMPSLYAVGIA